MHLLMCTENGKLTMFPVKKTSRIADKVKKIEGVYSSLLYMQNATNTRSELDPVFGM